MTELMMKMTFWLVASMALGFIVAWLLSQIFYTKKYKYKEDTLSTLILERNNMIDKLEKNFRNEKISSTNLSNDLEDLKKALSEKTSLLTTLQNKLNNSNTNKTTSLELKERNSFLQIKTEELEEVDSRRLRELEGFEEVLALAEFKIDENEKNYKKILKKLDENREVLTLENKTHEKNTMTYKKIITNFEEELKLYKTDSSGAEFIISKDQFLKIEEQLEKYKKEIKSLKNEKSEVFLKSKKAKNEAPVMDRTLEDKVVNELEKENDDSSMVKAFRVTYKKITNS